MDSTLYRSSPGLLSTSVYARNSKTLVAKLSHGGDSDHELFKTHDSDHELFKRGHRHGSDHELLEKRRATDFRSDSNVNYDYHEAEGGDGAIALIHGHHQNSIFHSDSNINYNYHEAEGGDGAIALIHGDHQYNNNNSGRASREFPRGRTGRRRSAQARPSVGNNAAAASGKFAQQNAPPPAHSPTGGSPTPPVTSMQAPPARPNAAVASGRVGQQKAPSPGHSQTTPVGLSGPAGRPPGTTRACDRPELRTVGQMGQAPSTQTRPLVGNNAAAANARFGQQKAPSPAHSLTTPIGLSGPAGRPSGATGACGRPEGRPAGQIGQAPLPGRSPAPPVNAMQAPPVQPNVAAASGRVGQQNAPPPASGRFRQQNGRGHLTTGHSVAAASGRVGQQNAPSPTHSPTGSSPNTQNRPSISNNSAAASGRLGQQSAPLPGRSPTGCSPTPLVNAVQAPPLRPNVAAASGRVGQQNPPSPRHSPTGCSPTGPGRRLPPVQYKRLPYGPHVQGIKVQRPPPPPILRGRQNQQPQRQPQGRPPPRRRCRFADDFRGRPLVTLHCTRPMTMPEDISKLYYTERDFFEFQRQADLEAENWSAAASAIAAAGAPSPTARLCGMDPRISSQARRFSPPPQQNMVTNGHHRPPQGPTVGQVRPAFRSPPLSKARMNAHRKACMHAHSAIDASRSRCY